MIETIKIFANWGFPAAMCVLFYWDFRKKIDKLDRTITNDLFHIIKEDSKNTKEVKEAITGLRIEIAKMNDKK